MNNTLFIIPARGGSKGIPKKNIKLLNDKPLLCFAIDAARELTSDKNICLSTDNQEFIKVAQDYGLEVPFTRPPELAIDEAGSEGVIRHAIEYYKNLGITYDKVVLLQPTSPFRKSSHIKAAIKLFEENLEMVVSVKETKSNPYYVLFEEDKDGFLRKSKKGNFIRRQDCPKVWEYNGAIYVINPKSLETRSIAEFTRIKKYQMDEISSLDIDSSFDWMLAEMIIKNHN